MCFYPDLNDWWERNTWQSLAFLPEVASVDWEMGLGWLPGKNWVCKILSNGFLLGLLDVKNTKMAVTFLTFTFSKPNLPQMVGCCKIRLCEVTLCQELCLEILHFHRFQISEVLTRFLHAFVLKPGEIWQRLYQALQMALGNFVGKFINFRVIKEFRVS